MSDPFTITLSDVGRCPILSLSPSHYRTDGSCRCKPKPGERKRVLCSCGCGASKPDDGLCECGAPLGHGRH